MLSRVADSLYWLSRYLERAEHTARLMDVHLNLVMDESRSAPLRARRERLLQSLWIAPTGDTRIYETDYALIEFLTFDAGNPASLLTTIRLARENARQVREQLSSEMWTQINRVYLDMTCARMDEVWGHQPHEFFRSVREGSHLFQGITDGTMNRNEGWQFIQLGRYIERAAAAARLLDVNYEVLTDHANRGDDYLQRLGLLKSVTSFEAYSKVYRADLTANAIIEFLLFNDQFPHAIRFCVDQVCKALEAITEETGSPRHSLLYRKAGRLQAFLSFDLVEDVLAGDLHRYLFDIQHYCHQIHTALYETYIAYTIEAM
ncbi:MAG: alpha-E domain-containing protein [bacterium]|nr:alpha-E domain-containing protein [bacterium]